MPTFSIVIPNLNQSRFLPSALESLRHQGNPFNLAVMDGGSTDGFQEVVGGYRDMIRMLRSGPDGGQAAAIEKGFDAMPGEILGWLNADDYYFPNILEKVAACFQADPKLDVLYGDAVHVTHESFFISYFPAVRQFDARALPGSCFICQPACFMRRSAYERAGGIDAGLQYTMDWDLWCRLAASGARFRYLREPLAAVRYYPQTKTMSGSRKRYMEIWRIERKYHHRLLPLSWAGFYWYDLFFGTPKGFREKAAFGILDRLRTFKKKITARESGTTDTLYGFFRWSTRVDRCAVIHVPWYGPETWKRICLRVGERNEGFRISVNDAPFRSLFSSRGILALEVPHMETPRRLIRIEHLEQRIWNLFGFSCETR